MKPGGGGGVKPGGGGGVRPGGGGGVCSDGGDNGDSKDVDKSSVILDISVFSISKSSFFCFISLSLESSIGGGGGRGGNPGGGGGVFLDIRIHTPTVISPNS